ncbi:MAG: Gfo/Idh/MocA family oxidoreductase [Sedimentisphaerales bacterium]|nr:Gfo/Idh/MocA family oxidoreductase [Sedimentisphaerales bacterium]MBN2841658.1 Gfo/Idh/MocA family oxidoreductase [Sedimentisphaerales bacterium]
MKTYKTAIIGLNSPLANSELIDQFQGNGRCKLCAVFDRNKVGCEDFAKKYNVAPYHDSRQLIVSEKPEIILLGLPNYQCGEIIHIAAASNSNIFKTTPAARDLSEIDLWIKDVRKNNCALAISCATRGNLLYNKITELINSKAIGTLYQSQITNIRQYEGVLDWRGEPTLSGGGVLLEDNFDLIDLLTRINGLPLRVYSVNSDQCKKISLPPYLTEDSAIATIEYPDHCIANLTCSWMAGMQKFELSFYGTEGSIHSDGLVIKQFDRNNGIIAQYEFMDENTLKATIRQFEHFLNHLDNPDLKLSCSADSFLNTIATINSAYLSATTKSPEEPAKLLGHL